MVIKIMDTACCSRCVVLSFYTIAAEGVTSDAQTSWSGPELSSSEKTLKFKAYALNEKMDLAPVRAV